MERGSPMAAVDLEAKAGGGAHHAGDRARSTDDRRLVVPMQDKVQRYGADRRQSPEYQESGRAQPIGKRRAEGGEPDHIDHQMRHRAVQEGIGERRGENSEWPGKGRYLGIELAYVAGRKEG